VLVDERGDFLTEIGLERVDEQAGGAEVTSDTGQQTGWALDETLTELEVVEELLEERTGRWDTDGGGDLDRRRG
jgi:hypothetical protein